ncbi:MAG: hypothetical protein RIR00_1549 [Pseudomonadota bacterium]|jgi:methionyl-tRNA formyltransferase
MKISIVCTHADHPVFPHLQAWQRAQRPQHDVELVHGPAELSGGDLLFLISCHQRIDATTRSRYRHSLVIHASDLPAGRGWSPLVWQILEGRQEIAVTLLEAAEQIDSGAIWHKTWLHFAGHELVDEIHAALFAAELELMDFAVAHCDTLTPQPQPDQGISHYRRRTPEDSRLDPAQSLAALFDQLRIADPQHYPAFFELRGHRYQLFLQKADSDDPELPR